jgi:alpha-L-fucosidase
MTSLNQISFEQETAAALDWWKNAKFGMFMHWGISAHAGGYWNGVEHPGLSEWIQSQAKIPHREYAAQLCPNFNPQSFNAQKIIGLAKSAGMKYFVVTAKHHDGFAMYDSKYSDFTITKATPFHRDPLKELADACKDQDIKFCIYYSQELDWEHPHGGGNNWDKPSEEKDFGIYFEEKCKPQVRELLTNYGDIGLIWFDMGSGFSSDYALELKTLVKNLQPSCLVNARIGAGYGDYGNLGDNQVPYAPLEGGWECPATMNNNWGYKINDDHWKSSSDIIRVLSDLSSKEVNYLLNIGPDQNGEVPQSSVKILNDISNWMQKNHPSIYSTKSLMLPQEYSWGRLSTKENFLYLTFYEQVEQPFVFNGLINVVKQVKCLSQPSTDISFEQQHLQGDITQLKIDTSSALKDEEVSVFEIECDADIKISRDLFPDSHGELRLTAFAANYHDEYSGERKSRQNSDYINIAAIEAEKVNECDLHKDFMCGISGTTINWFHEEDWLSWSFHSLETKDYEAKLISISPKYKKWSGDHHIEISIDGHKQRHDIKKNAQLQTPGQMHYEVIQSDIGRFKLEKGNHNMELRTISINENSENGLCLQAVILMPIKTQS